MAHVRKEMISFFVTTKCNLNCSYCYTNKGLHAGETISLRFALAGLRDYFRTSSSRHIRFFGAGEPTLEITLIKSILTTAKEIAHEFGGHGVTSEIQTNGVFGRPIAEWLAKTLDIIWVSSDGLPTTHDKYRVTASGKPTSRSVERSVRYLSSHSRGVVGIRATITQENVSSQIELLEYFRDLGARAVWSDPVFPAVGQTDVVDGLDPLMYAREFVKAAEWARSEGLFYGSILTCNFDEDSRQHCRACIPVPHLTSDGFVSACDMALFGDIPAPMSTFIYGHWNPVVGRIEYDQERIATIRSRVVENMPGCQGCPAKLRCGGFCLGEVTNESGSLFGQKPRTCAAIRYLWEHLPRPVGLFPVLHP